MGSFQPYDETGDDGYPPHQFEMVYPSHAHETWFGDEYWHRIDGEEGYVKRSGTTHQDAPFEYLKLGPLEFRWSRFTWLEGKFGDKRVAAAVVQAITTAHRP